MKNLLLLPVFLILFATCHAQFSQPGEMDTTFNFGFTNSFFSDTDNPRPGVGANGGVSAFALQSDGKILIGGGFQYFNGKYQRGIARLNTDGRLDPSFNSGTGVVSGVNAGSVGSIVLQPDGKVLIGGNFTTYNNTPRNFIARLNSDGSLDATFNPGTGLAGTSFTGIESLVLQADGKIVIGGWFTSFNGIPRNYIARLNEDGSLDTTFNPGSGPNTAVRSLALQPDGKVIVGGQFTSYNGTPRNNIVRLNTDGSLDPTFVIGTGADLTVYSLALQPDGKVLIGGTFTTYNGTTRNRIARLNPSGSLDVTFNPGSGTAGNYPHVNSIALQTDGKVLIAGSFTSYNGSSRNRIARLDPNGSLDATFNPGLGAADGPYISPSISTCLLHPDGKVLIGGGFHSYGGVASYNIARISIDGSLDATFNPGTGSNGPIVSLALQSDGRVLIGGNFTSCNNRPRNRIARLNVDGTLDETFNPGAGANNQVLSCAIQPDNKVLIVGVFTTYNGTSRNGIARLNADGSLDATFNPGTGVGGSSQIIYSCAMQSDGKVLIGGLFTNYNGTPRNNIARLNADGSLDATFNPGTGTNFGVNFLTIQPDGKVLIGGGFTTYNGTASNRIARLNADGSLDETFTTGNGPNSLVQRLVLQPDQKVIIVGNFTSINFTTRNGIARLNSNGSLDASFNPGTGASGGVQCLALQSDGKILIGGGFGSYNGTFRNKIARLNLDGSLDNTFDPGLGVAGVGTPVIQAINVQSDGKILIGGEFVTYNYDFYRSRIVRVLSTNCASIATNTTSSSSICAGSTKNLTGTPGGNWVLSGPGSITGSTYNATGGAGTVSIINEVGGCTSPSVTFTVNPLPATNAGPDFSSIQNSSNVNLNGSPANGLWSGPGVTNGIFNSSQPLGQYNLSYCYTNSEGCSKCDTVVVTIIPSQQTDCWRINESSLVVNNNCGYSKISVQGGGSNSKTVRIFKDNTLFSTPGDLLEQYGMSPGNYYWEVKTLCPSDPDFCCRDTIAFQIAEVPCNHLISEFTILNQPSSSFSNDGKVRFTAIGNFCSSERVLVYQNISGTWFIIGQFAPNSSRVFEKSNLGEGTYRWILNSPLASSCADTIEFTLAVPTITEIAKPIISPATGTYPDPISVSISCATPGATIYYTTSGNLPVVGTGFTRVYSGPFQQIQTGTIRAMAVLSGLPNSAIATSFITITNPGIAANPVISPGTGSYSGAQTISISCATQGASIYYATGGYMPVLNSPNSYTKLYSGPFTINSSTTIRAIAVKAGIVNSGVSVANLTITNPTPVVATPTISPSTGIYAGTQTVTISTATPGSTIYYATTGNTPVIGTGFTKIYTGSFNISSSATVRAMATAPGFLNSGVGVSFITIGAGRVAVDNFEEVISESEFIQILKAFPNPTTGFVNLRTSEPIENVTLELFNSVGQLVFKKESYKLENETISIHSMPNGIYNLKVTAPNYTRDIRIVKQ